MQVKRTEIKFILNSQERVLAQKSIGAVMPKDRYCVSADGYEVRSLYFDTFSDRACAEKEEGLQEHEKIRARIYGTDDCIIKLESKRKNGELQTKDSMLIDRNTLENLCVGNYNVLLQNNDSMAIYFYIKLSQGMAPKAIIQGLHLILIYEPQRVISTCFKRSC